MHISMTRKRVALSIVTFKRIKFPKFSVILFSTKHKPRKCHKISLIKKPKTLNPHNSSNLNTSFSHYDSDQEERVDPENIGIMIRTLDGNPTQAELNDIVNTEGLNGQFDFHKFVGLMRKHLQAKPMDLEFHRALESIDNDCYGYINVSKLRDVLTTMGESLDPEELDEWIRAIGVEPKESVSYEDNINPMIKIA